MATYGFYYPSPHGERAQMVSLHVRDEEKVRRTVLCHPTAGSEQRNWTAGPWVWAGQV